MGKISSQFVVTSLEDGLTIHGSLTSDRTLTQTVGNTITPDWTDPTKQPTITLRVLKGNQYVPAQNYKWYINGDEIVSSDSRFVMSTVTIEGVSCPTLKIVQNLGGPGNLDLDLITIGGKIESNGALLDFSAGIQVKISRLTGSGYIPTICFVDGKSYIDTKGEYICAYALLATENGNVSGYTCKWYLNYDQEVTATSRNNCSYKSTVTIGGVTYPCLYIYEGDVEDYTVVRCEYIKDNEVVAVETVDVDDQQDPDMMYITYGAQSSAYNGTPASLKTGQSVTFNIWVARNDDPNHEATMAKYTSYKVKLLNSSAEVITASIIVGATIQDGWAVLTPDAGHRIHVTISYEQAVQYGKGKITGLVQALTA